MTSLEIEILTKIYSSAIPCNSKIFGSHTIIPRFKQCGFGKHAKILELSALFEDLLYKYVLPINNSNFGAAV